MNPVFHKTIPNDIKINIIEPFTRNTQEKELCDDIKSFTTTFKCIFSVFFTNVSNFIFNNVDNGTIGFVPPFYILKCTWIFLEIELIEYLIINKLLFEILDRYNYGKPKLSFKYHHILNMPNTNIGFREKIVFYKKSKRIVKNLWCIMKRVERYDFIHIKMNNDSLLLNNI